MCESLRSVTNFRFSVSTIFFAAMIAIFIPSFYNTLGELEAKEAGEEFKGGYTTWMAVLLFIGTAALFVLIGIILQQYLLNVPIE